METSPREARVQGGCVDQKEKLDMLQKLDEKTLTEKIILPLYQSRGMGCTNVRYTHRVLEFGKDVVYYKDDENKRRLYTGIQVKRGRITKKQAVTIFHQIFEAFGEPFKDLSDNKEKSLDRFLVITSGAFTEEAKDSLIASLKGALLDKVTTLIDGNQLVDLLDENFPDAFWEEYDHFTRYCNAMKREFERIKDISAIGQKEPIELEKIYVSLKLSEKRELQPQPKMLPEKREREREEGEEELERHEYERELLEKRIEDRNIEIDADDAVNQFQKMVIVGIPGSGKTTLLKHLAIKSCRENLETLKRTVVPIFIRLSDFSDSHQALREYLTTVFEKFDFPQAEEFIEKDLKDGKCQLLLDGLDELAAKERQSEVTALLEEFIRTYPQNQFIVTSRIAGYNDELKEFEKFEIREFTDDQVEQFITNWFGKTDPEKADSMKEVIRTNEKIKTLVRNPLMVAITAIIYEEDRKLPQRRVELYQRCVEVLLNKWDITRKVKNEYEAKAKEKILKNLALDIHTAERRSFPKDEVLGKFSTYLPEVNIDKGEAENVLDEIVLRNGLLSEVSIGGYSFSHLSFQEYLTALELWGQGDYERLLEHWYDPWWEEVVLLFAGMERDATKLIENIQEKEKNVRRFKEDIFYSNLILMGKCIADADFTKKKIREKINNDLWFLYENTEFTSLREKVISIISLIKPVYYHTDHLCSTRLVTTENGVVAEEIAYEPFGGEIGTFEERYTYNGKELDETGLYYYGARYYDPPEGRFLTRDKLEPDYRNPQSLNRYSYCRNNPLLYVDPDGRMEKKFSIDCGGQVSGEQYPFAATVGEYLTLFGFAEQTKSGEISITAVVTTSIEHGIMLMGSADTGVALFLSPEGNVNIEASQIIVVDATDYGISSMGQNMTENGLSVGFRYNFFIGESNSNVFVFVTLETDPISGETVVVTVEIYVQGKDDPITLTIVIPPSDSNAEVV